jgi:hypothetical protein
MSKYTKITREKLDWLLSQNTEIMIELIKNQIEMSRVEYSSTK